MRLQLEGQEGAVEREGWIHIEPWTKGGGGEGQGWVHIKHPMRVMDVRTRHKEQGLEAEARYGQLPGIGSVRMEQTRPIEKQVRGTAYAKSQNDMEKAHRIV